MTTIVLYITFANAAMKYYYYEKGTFTANLGAKYTSNKGNNKITELRTILQRESQNS